MTYARAKLIIWNPATYSRQEIRTAAVFVLSLLGAKAEDVQQAASLL